MTDVTTLTDAELEELRRAVLGEQEARFLKRRQQAAQQAAAASAASALETELHRFLDHGGSVEEIRALSETVAAAHARPGNPRTPRGAARA